MKENNSIPRDKDTFLLITETILATMPVIHTIVSIFANRWWFRWANTKSVPPDVFTRTANSTLVVIHTSIHLFANRSCFMFADTLTVKYYTIKI